jgi:hypothetical protein
MSTTSTPEKAKALFFAIIPKLPCEFYKLALFFQIRCRSTQHAVLNTKLIGFVFSNSPFQLVSDLELSASDFRPKAGKLALFFQIYS